MRIIPGTGLSRSSKARRSISDRGHRAGFIGCVTLFLRPPRSTLLLPSNRPENSRLSLVRPFPHGGPTGRVHPSAALRVPALRFAPVQLLEALDGDPRAL